MSTQETETPQATTERRHFVRKVCLIHKLLYALFEFGDSTREERYLYFIDLSPGGMRFSSASRLRDDGPFYLVFSLKGIRTENYYFSGDFYTQAKVAWQKPQGDQWMTGLQFFYLPDETKELITRLTHEFGESRRHQHVRLKDAVSVSFRPAGSEAEWWRGQTHDMSPHGMVAKFGVSTEAEVAPFEAGQQLEVKLPEQHIHAVAEVKWQRSVGEHKRETGLHFIEVPTKDAQTLHDFLKQAAPAAVGDRVVPPET